MKKNFITMFFGIFLSTSLAGCMNTAISSAQAVYDRHSINKTWLDRSITISAYKRIYSNNQRYQRTNVAFNTFNQIVLMTGQIPDPKQSQEMEFIIKNLPDVNQVYNLTVISAPASALTTASDSWITSKIGTKFLASTEINPSQFKIITENGIVYLMGIVPSEQAEAAVEIARTTAGVQSVVKIFSYLKISKTA